MDPDLSALPMSYMYWDRAREKPRLSVLDGVSTGDFPSRVLMQHWAARYLRKDIKNAKTSVFADVVDGICLQDSAGHAKVNHQNMVAILHILRSIIEVDLPQRNIIVITFFPEAAVAMRKFLKSQKIASVRVEHVDSDKIKIKENLISIIDCPMTGSPGADRGHGMREATQGRLALANVLECSSESKEWCLRSVFLEDCGSSSEARHFWIQDLAMIGRRAGAMP
jgi:hypothetical protein